VLETDGTHQPATAVTPVSAARAEQRSVAWVGRFVVFKGDLVSSEDLTIDGRVEGTIRLPEHDLTIGPDADIRAEIVAKSVTIFGAVTGTITAGARLNIREVGSVIGDVTAPRVSVSDGATLQGRVETAARPPSTT
jgi:cytoskeletal protein CcmA (bactofilin family)